MQSPPNARHAGHRPSWPLLWATPAPPPAKPHSPGTPGARAMPPAPPPPLYSLPVPAAPH
ncbi:hypothetical protein P7K49_006003, partial [Saguinus oedipus]